MEFDASMMYSGRATVFRKYFVRIRSHWNDKEKTFAGRGSRSAGIYRMAYSRGCLLNLENEGFQTDTQSQRLDVLQEFCAFLIHVTDRMVHESMNDEQRQRFIVELALKMADTYHDNRVDAEGRGQDFRQAFIDTSTSAWPIMRNSALRMVSRVTGSNVTWESG